MKIEFSQEDFDLLLLTIGYATGAAMVRGELEQADRFVYLANQVNKNNPNWKPYECATKA
jgi:hypothetical protein